MTDVLLILPPWGTHLECEASMEFAENSNPPLNLAYLAAYLREKGGFDCVIEDLRLYSPYETMTEERIDSIVSELIDKHVPRIVGITSITQTYPEAETIAKSVKRTSSDIWIVGGGIHATFSFEELINDGFDFIIRGEGEQSLLDLCDFLINKHGNLDEINGLCWAGNHGKLQPAFLPIGEIPIPARDLLKMDEYMKKGTLITSRGCNHNCNFCACAAIYSRRIRRNPLVRVIAEMKHIMNEYLTRDFLFHDDTFCSDSVYTEEFCRLIRTRLGDISFGCQTRADTMDPGIANALVGAGCRTIQFGVESGNQRLLDKMKKGITLEKVTEAVKCCQKAGIEFIGCNLIIGHPDDTYETVMDTIEFGTRLLDIGATNIGLSVLTPLPGSEVYACSKELGIKIHKDPRFSNWAEANISTRHLSRKEIQELYSIGMGVLQNRIKRKEKRTETRNRKLATRH